MCQLVFLALLRMSKNYILQIISEGQVYGDNSENLLFGDEF